MTSLPSSLDTSDIEAICRRVFGEMKSAIDTQQAVMVEQMRAMNSTLIDIKDSLRSNFVRRETHDSLSKTLDELDRTAARKDDLNPLRTFIYGAIGLGGTAFAGAFFALIFRK